MRSTGGGAVSRELYVRVAEEAADPERLDTLTGFLREELRATDVESVARVSTNPPAGAKAIDAVAVGELVVALGQSATGLKDVISAIKSWLWRGNGARRSVRLQIEGDVLELSVVSSEEQRRLVDLFVDRHATGGK